MLKLFNFKSKKSTYNCQSFKNSNSIFLWDVRDKTIAVKLMYIPNDETQNYSFCRLQLVVETFGHSTKRT